MLGLQRLIGYAFYLVCILAVIGYGIVLLLDWSNPFYQAAVSDFDKAAELDPTCKRLEADRKKAQARLESKH